MEIVERRLGGAADEVEVRVLDRDLSHAVPFEQHRTGRDVDLLHDPGVDPAEARAAEHGQVGPRRPIDQQQRGPPRGQVELVQVGPRAVPGLDGCDVVVPGVIDNPLADAVPVTGDRALPPGQHRVAPILLDGQPHRRLVRPGQRKEPHQPPGPVHDHRPLLARARPGIPLRGEHHVPRRTWHARSRVADRQRGRCQIRPGHEPAHRRRWLRRRGFGPGPPVPHIPGNAGGTDQDPAAQHRAQQPAAVPTPTVRSGIGVRPRNGHAPS